MEEDARIQDNNGQVQVYVVYSWSGFSSLWDNVEMPTAAAIWGLLAAIAPLIERGSEAIGARSAACP